MPDAAATTGAPPRATGARARLVLALAAVAAALAAARLLPVDRWLLDFVAWVRSAGMVGVVVFVAAYVLACVCFLPGSVLTLGAGFAYGVAAGTPIVWVAANLGATLAFLLGRTVAREWVARRVAAHPRFAAVDRAVGRQGFRIVLLTRLSPVFPFNLLNYAYGVTGVALRDYVLGSLLGMIPGTVLYVYLGSLVTSVTELASGRRPGGAAREVFYVLGFAATVAATVVATRIARRALAETTAEPAPSGEAPGDAPLVLPDDEPNRALVAAVHPPGWRNPAPAGRYNLVVLGAGTAGLVSAAGAAGLGARVALVERGLMGGDCLNVGCVPSKALVAAARVAATARRAGEYGVRTGRVDVDFPAVMARMRRLRARLAPNDGAARFTALGVDVFLGAGRFTGPTTVEVGGATLAFARAVVATGARPATPPIPGLAAVGHLTNESLFWLTELPRRLAVVGGGPIGCEMAQAFARFGSEVVLFETGPRVLPRDDADAAAIVARRLAADGVRLLLGARVVRVARDGGETAVHFEHGGRPDRIACDRILVAVGRAPNLDGLGLDAAGVAATREGVTVNDFLQTTNPRVYAAGDVASRFQFTHTADALARIVLANALFLGRRRASALAVPWCTYTSPEVAHVGLSADEARARGWDVRTITVPLADVDRAVLDGEDDGFLRVHHAKGRLLGATLVAEHAGDTISELTLAMAGRLGLGTLAATIHPYPTQAEALRKAGDAYNRARLGPRGARLLARWLAFRR
ncbi:MAG TPA: FAD-containing oxidoreductase [Candidatus Binatia bacterium]|nr:FAD-containing oxidoreductase [Candidatus Binatia bacterium]